MAKTKAREEAEKQRLAEEEEKQKLLEYLKCYNFKLELRLHLDKDLREVKGYIEVVKRKDIGEYLRYIYWYEQKQ